jgi:uncharacterized membrane protein YhhN
MTLLVLLSVALTIGALPFLLVGETAGPEAMKWVSKPLASAGFLSLGLLSSAGSAVQGVLMTSLVLCALGDVCLLSSDRRLFRAGLVSFLLGHVGYCVVFALHGLSLPALLGALVVLVPLARRVWGWLKPHLPGGMSGPVFAYILIITAMVTLAVAAGVEAAAAPWLVGAGLFFVSDLFVARHRFIAHQPVNRMVGLPLYYVGQLILAATLGAT